MINPVILKKEGTTIFSEGCLSLPGETEDVERAANVRVKFQDVDGTERELDCDGLLAIAVQHETDHLHGIMVTDHISALKRELIRKRMKRLKSSQEAQKKADPRGSSASV
jgi:peptide deformylase